MFTTNQIKEEYWESLSIDEKDIEFIYNHLLEKEIPLSTKTLLISLINQRILREKMNAEKQKSKSISVYLPKNEYEIGDVLSFPAFEKQSGTVVKIREGLNPEYDNLKVIEVKFDSGEVKEFAGNIDAHPLNHVLDISEDDPNYDPQAVFSTHGKEILSVLEAALNKNEDLVNIAGCWFPRSLLLDVHVGHLNLAEAALEEVNGGPLGTDVLMEQVEFSANADKKLLEFSFDLALQEDERFDEVGPAGKTLWFLYALEPDPVKNTPLFLKYSDDIPDAEPLSEYMSLFESNIYDELEKWDSNIDNNNQAVISLSYPHWRTGTLPLSNTLKNMFPTAYEAPRVKFSFVDSKNNEKFPGWVVREKKYVFGLKNWYEKYNLIPGSLVVIENSKIPGEINIQFNKSRQNKEWIKTVLI